MNEIPDYIGIANKRFIRNCCVFGLMLALLWLLFYLALSFHDYSLKFLSRSVHVLGFSLCLTLAIAYAPRIRTAYRENKKRFYFVSAGLVVSYILIAISCMILFLPVKRNDVSGFVCFFASINFALIPITINLLLMPIETFLNKNLLLGLNWKYAGVNYPLYTGWPVKTFCPEAAAMLPEVFHEKAEAFGQFLAANGIVHRWIIKQDTAVYYFYLDPNLKPITMSQGIIDLKYGKTLVALKNTGEMTLQISPADMKLFSKLRIKGPALNDLLAMFRDAARNFFVGQSEVAMQWLINKPQPRLQYQTAKGKFLAAMLPLCIIMLITLKSISSDRPDFLEQDRNFITQSQNRDGSLGYARNCDDCRSPLWNSAAGILFLNRFGGLEKIDVDAAARFMASKQQKDGMFAGEGGTAGSVQETQIAMQALAAVDRTGLIDVNALVRAVASKQKPDGLWPAVKKENLSSYEATYLSLRILENAGMLNAANLDAARKTLLADKNDVHESMAWFLYEIDRMSGNKPRATKPMIEMNQKHIEYIREQRDRSPVFSQIYNRELCRAAALISASNEKYDAPVYVLERRLSSRSVEGHSRGGGPDEVGDFYPAMPAYHDLLEFKKRNPPPAWWSIRYSGPLGLWILCATALCVWFIRKEIQPL